MTPLKEKLDMLAVHEYIQRNIGPSFFDKSIGKLKGLTLKAVLSRKNPFLCRAKGLTTPNEIIESLVDATASSSEETNFGNFSERLAIAICEQVHGGRKSAVPGLDVEMDDEANKIRHLISVKSGPNWANSEQKKKLIDAFKAAKKILRTSGGCADWSVKCVEGCCYGKDDNPAKDTHEKLCGERFWEYISGSATLYKDIIKPLGSATAMAVASYNEERSAAIDRLVLGFTKHFVTSPGVIDWEKWVQYNSGIERGGIRLA